MYSEYIQINYKLFINIINTSLNQLYLERKKCKQKSIPITIQTHIFIIDLIVKHLIYEKVYLKFITTCFQKDLSLLKNFIYLFCFKCINCINYAVRSKLQKIFITSHIKYLINTSKRTHLKIAYFCALLHPKNDYNSE